MLKTPPESDQWFQSYSNKDSQNNRKQKKCILSWLYLTINAPNFRLIPLDLNTHETHNMIATFLVVTCVKHKELDLAMIV